ncbi:hypothetical protein COV21_03980 [Candidatus Woesearchaeota archaeon CG10_big_fil_rev_8_21_14_0_10_45_5]|nr:MAG: hypothetical protein COV21_03980 [Candidatus Woesearchaeota archaeon CG10_big_fil_rev_8_21_14_0_10_45_5]
MKEKEVVKAIKNHVSNQNDGWNFVMGREVLTKQTFLQRLGKDKKFRTTVIDMVYKLSIDILTRKGNSE